MTEPRRAWALIETEYDEGGGYVACMVVENETGYVPARGNGACAAPWYLGKTLDEAAATRDAWNLRDFGLSPDEAHDVKSASILLSIRTGAIG